MTLKNVTDVNDAEKLIDDYFLCCDSLNEDSGKKIVKPYGSF